MAEFSQRLPRICVFSHRTHVAVPTLFPPLATRNTAMRTLHSFAQPFLPSPTDPFSLIPHMPQLQQDNNDRSLSPQQQNIALLVTPSFYPRNATPFSLPFQQTSQNDSRSPSSASPPAVADPSQLSIQPQSPNTQMSIQSLLAASRQGPGKDSPQQLFTLGSISVMSNGEQPANGQVRDFSLSLLFTPLVSCHRRCSPRQVSTD